MEGGWLPPQAPGSSPPPPPAANNEAVAAIVCGLAGAGLLFWTNGLSSLISLILGLFGVVYARRAKRNVEQGLTRKHADMAGAASIASWITVAISLLATAVWGGVLLIG